MRGLVRVGRSNVARRYWAAVLLFLLPLWAMPTMAAECRMSVDSHADAGPGSLRDRLEQAALLDTPCLIDFGDRDGPFATPRTIRLEQPLPLIAGDITIDGFIDGLLWRAYGVTVSGQQKHRLFEVAEGASLMLRGITLSEGFADRGAAILNRGRLIVDSSSLFDNRASDSGGAIFNAGDAVLVNSTLIGNHALLGGALASEGQMRITHATFHENQAEAGGAVYASTEALFMANSIVSGPAMQCLARSDSDGMIHNLISGDHRGCGEPILTVDPLFERPGYYNGPTMTLPINGASHAINIARPEFSVDVEGRRLTWDQRGNGDPRFAGGFADLGAFERQGLLPDSIVVNIPHDNGLRVCTGQGSLNCPLRAAIELAVAGRHLVPIHFSANVFQEPTRLVLESTHGAGQAALKLDGRDEVSIEIQVPCPVAWSALGGVTIEIVEKDKDCGE